MLASSVHVECPLPSAQGDPVLWQITLNEAEGTADVVIGPLDPMRVKAAFLPETVRFYVTFVWGQPGMKVDLSRVNLKIARYTYGEGHAPEYGQCKLVKTKPTAF